MSHFVATLSTLLVLAVTATPASALSTDDAPSVRVELLDGTTHSGSLQSLRDASLVVQTPRGESAEWTFNQIARIRFSSPTNSPPREAPLRVHTADGSEIVAARFASKDNTFELHRPSGETLRGLTSTLRAVTPAVVSAAEAETLTALRAESSSNDRLLIEGDGRLESYAGYIGAVTSETVRFDLDGEVLPLPRQKVWGLLFSTSATPPRQTSEPRRVILWDGSFLTAASWKMQERTMTVKTIDGITLDVAIDAIDSIELADAVAVPLAELGPPQSDVTPFFPLGRPPATFAMMFGPRLREDNVIEVRAGTTLRYALDRPYQRLRATVQAVGPASNQSVRIIIQPGTDASDTIQLDSHSPQEVNVALAPSRQLVLQVPLTEATTPRQPRLRIIGARLLP